MPYDQQVEAVRPTMPLPPLAAGPAVQRQEAPESAAQTASPTPTPSPAPAPSEPVFDPVQTRQQLESAESFLGFLQERLATNTDPGANDELTQAYRTHVARVAELRGRVNGADAPRLTGPQVSQYRQNESRNAALIRQLEQRQAGIRSTIDNRANNALAHYGGVGDLESQHRELDAAIERLRQDNATIAAELARAEEASYSRRRGGSRSWKWGDNGLEEEIPDEADRPTRAQEATANQRVNVSVGLGHDFTPEFVQDWNKQIKAYLDGLAKSWKEWLAETFGTSAPNLVALEAKLVLGQIGAKAKRVQAEGDDGEFHDSAARDDGQAAAEAFFEAKARVGWEFKASEIALAFWDLGPDWNKHAVDFALGGERFKGELTYDASYFLGLEGEAKVGVNSETGLEEQLGRFFGAFRDQTANTASEEASSGLADSQQAAQTSGAEVPKVAGDKETSSESSKPLASVGGEAKLFAGAKVGVSAAAGLKWAKQPAVSYVNNLEDALVLLSAFFPPMSAALTTYHVAKEIDPETVPAMVVGFLIGAGGEVDVIKAQAKAEGTAGLGLEGKLQLQLGRTIKFTMAGNATFGLGGGINVGIEADPIEAARLALMTPGIVGEQFAAHVSPYLVELGARAKAAIEETVTAVGSYFASDDDARAAVDEGRHLLMGADERAALVRDMVEGYAGAEDEARINIVLRFSRSQGPSDLTTVIDGPGFTELVGSIHGDNWQVLRSLLRESYYGYRDWGWASETIAALCQGSTVGWEERMIADILLAQGGSSAAAILYEVGYSVVMSELGDAERERLTDLLIASVYPQMGMDERVEAIGWLVSGRTDDWCQQQIIEILRPTSWDEYAEIVDAIGKWRLDLNLTGAWQDQLDAWS